MAVKTKTSEEILNAVAPCSMFCSTCTGCKYGEISYHASELLRLLEEFKEFSRKLKKYAYPRCNGCRNNRSSSCSIKNCFIPECTKEHNVDFCGNCEEFPCTKVNKEIFKEEIIQKWLEGNKKIRESGIDDYYKNNKDIPHYIDYKKKGKNEKRRFS